MPKAIVIARPGTPLFHSGTAAARRRGFNVDVIDLVTLEKPEGIAALLSHWNKERAPRLILTELNLGSTSAQRLKSSVDTAHPDAAKGCAWVTLAQSYSREQQLRLAYSGILEVLPYSQSGEHEIIEAITRCESRLEDPRRELADLVSLISGVQLDESKNTLIEKRLTRRMMELGLRSVADYMDWFRANRDRELPELLSQLTTHTTEFFRDTSHFDLLIDEALPAWLANSPSEPIRIWSAACSTGEEVYSIAIALLEGFRARGLFQPKFEIFGTDIDLNSIRTAQKGIYPATSVQKIAKPLQDRWFNRGTGELGGLYKIKDEVWNHCKFRIQNLNSESWPDGPFHAIFARNVFIYFKKDEVHRICRRMGEILRPDGRLHIGYSESIEREATDLRGIGKAIYVPLRSPAQLKGFAAADPAAPSRENQPSKLPNRGTTRTCRVLIVDDSATIRHALKKILTPEHGFAIVGEAKDPHEAIDLLKTREVDLMTLDLHMPGMDGIEYLQRIQGDTHPPVVVISSVNREEAVEVLKCLELGASDYIEKPQGMTLEDSADRIRQILLGVMKKPGTGRIGHRQSGSEAAIGPGIQWNPKHGQKDLILIGASTGGIEAIRSVVARLPDRCPPIIVVQHIPKLFSALFANRLNDISKIKCLEAADGMKLEDSHLYIAPGGFHIGVAAKEGSLQITTHQTAPLHGCRPAVDHLFNSVAALLGPGRNASFPWKLRVSAGLLTGMGRDGAQGMKLLHDRGVVTIAQNEESCVVYGMPKAAMELGAVDHCIPLNSIAWHLLAALEEAEKRKKKGTVKAA